MKEAKPAKKKQPNPIGIRVSPGLHDLFSQAAKNKGFDIGQAYSIAAVDWLKKNSDGVVVRALIDEACSESTEIRALFNRSISKAG